MGPTLGDLNTRERRASHATKVVVPGRHDLRNWETIALAVAVLYRASTCHH